MIEPEKIISFDEARDRDWAQAGGELEYGTELLLEWGVRFTYPDASSRVSIFGTEASDGAAARRFIAGCLPSEGAKVEVVARRVLYGPWGERDGD